MQHERKISDYVTAGEVAAAIESESEKIVKLGDITPEWWI